MSAVVNILQGKDAVFQMFIADADGHPVDITGYTLVRLRLPATASAYVEKLEPLTTAVNAVQTLAFGAVPDAGSFKVGFGTQQSALLPFGATASAIQAALRAFSGLKDVVVSGSFGANFVATFSGSDGGRAQLPLTILSNTLTSSSTPVVATVTQTVLGVPEAGISVLSAVQGIIRVELSEADTAAMKVGVKLDMDLTVRLGTKDLNIPTVKGLLNVSKNSFA